MRTQDRTLAIETATEACSVALFEGEELVAHRHEILGRGHAERLIPMIAELPKKGRADRILVSLGPGSFTGVRIGIAAARALGFAWQAEVLGYPTLSLVASMAKTKNDPVLVCMHGGHGEWFVRAFDADCAPLSDSESLPPNEAAQRFDHAHVAGSRAKEFVELKGCGNAQHVLPDAQFALKLPFRALTGALSPIYSREPDAKPQAAQKTGAAA